jgi:hypothetical protein
MPLYIFPFKTISIGSYTRLHTSPPELDQSHGVVRGRAVNNSTVSFTHLRKVCDSCLQLHKKFYVYLFLSFLSVIAGSSKQLIKINYYSTLRQRKGEWFGTRVRCSIYKQLRPGVSHTLFLFSCHISYFLQINIKTHDPRKTKTKSVIYITNTDT